MRFNSSFLKFQFYGHAAFKAYQYGWSLSHHSPSFSFAWLFTCPYYCKVLGLGPVGSLTFVSRHLFSPHRKAVTALGWKKKASVARTALPRWLSSKWIPVRLKQGLGGDEEGAVRRLHMGNFRSHVCLSLNARAWTSALAKKGSWELCPEKCVVSEQLKPGQPSKMAGRRIIQNDKQHNWHQKRVEILPPQDVFNGSRLCLHCGFAAAGS